MAGTSCSQTQNDITFGSTGETAVTADPGEDPAEANKSGEGLVCAAASYPAGAVVARLRSTSDDG